MSLFDSPQEFETPVLRRIAEPALYTAEADLTNPAHPVNDKAASGKSNGMGILIGNELWVATGSKSTDSWVRIGATNLTPEAVRDLLQTLQGAERLDASAIKNIPGGASPDDILMILGLAAKPNEWVQADPYANGDKVYRTSTNRIYQANKNIASGTPFNTADWDELSIEMAYATIRNLQTEVAKLPQLRTDTDANTSAVTEFRGGTRPADWNAGTTYVRGDRMFHPFAGRVYKAKTTTSGSFKQADWEEETLKGIHDEVFTHQRNLEDIGQGLYALAGQDADYPEYRTDNPNSYPTGTIVHLSSTNRNYQAKVDVPPNAGAFNPAQWDEFSVHNNGQAATQARRIEALQGNDKLDYNSLKNLPSSQGGYQTKVDNAGVNPAGGTWYDVATFPSTVDAYGVKFEFRSSDPQVHSTTSVFGGNAASDNHGLMVENRVSNYPLDARSVKYRTILQGGAIRVQVYLSMSQAYDIQIVGLGDVPSNFGTLVANGSNPDAVFAEQDLTDIPEGQIAIATPAAIVTSSVGDPITRRAWIDFMNQVVELKAGGQTIQSVSSSGTSFYDGHFGDWRTQSAETPFETVNTFPTITSLGRTDPEDTTRNPFGTIALDGLATGITWRSFVLPEGDRNCLQWDNLGNSSVLRVRFSGAGISSRSVLEFGAVFRAISNPPDADETFEVRLGSINGTVIATWNIAEAIDNYILFTANHAVTAAESAADEVDFFIVQTAGSGTATNRSGLSRFYFDVISPRADLDQYAVGQFNSNFKGIKLPNMLSALEGNYSRGTIGLDDNDQPVIKKGKLCQISSINNETADAAYGAYYNSDVGSGLPADQAWSVSGDASHWGVQHDVDGFPQLLHFNNIPTSGLNTMSTGIDDSDAFWTAARTQGLIVTQRIMVKAEWSGNMIHNAVEPKNVGGWPAGRWFWNIDGDGSGNVSLAFDSASGVITTALSLNKMHTINLVVTPNSEVGTLVLDGKPLGVVSYGGYNGQRGLFYTFGTNNVRDTYVQEASLTIMQDTATNRVFTREEIVDSIRYVIPTTANNFVLTMPRGAFPVGTTFTVVNGGSREVDISGATNDTQLFGGDLVGKIPAGTECTLVQSGFPNGNIWTMSNKTTQRTPTSQGQRAIFNVNTAGNFIPTSLHGTFSGAIDVEKQGVGQYRLIPDGYDSHVFSETNSVLQVQLINAPINYNIIPSFALGFPTLEVRDPSNNLVDHAFSAALYW